MLWEQDCHPAKAGSHEFLDTGHRDPYRADTETIRLLEVVARANAGQEFAMQPDNDRERISPAAASCADDHVRRDVA